MQTDPSGAQLLHAFASPPTDARPMLRWWWPGGAVEDAVLRQQLRAFHAGGFGGVEVQPFRVGLPHGLPAALAVQVHDFATPGFRDRLAGVVEEATRLGMVVDATFGSAWPFGGGEAITPELAASEVTLAFTTVQGPVRWHGCPVQPAQPRRSGSWLRQQGLVDPAQGVPPDWVERLATREAVMSVVAFPGTAPETRPYPGFVPMTLPDVWGEVSAPGWVDAAEAIDLTDQLDAEGRLDWQVPAGEWQIVVCKRVALDQLIGEAAGRGPQLVLDHMNAAAFEAHAQRVGGALPPGLRAVFVDSLEMPADLPWTDDFAFEFERRRGYPVRPWMALLLQPGWRNAFQARVGSPLFDDPDWGARVRADYRLTVSELMLERLYAPFTDWAAAHGLQSRVQAHGAPVDWLQAYGMASMPETEDLMGQAAPHFLKVARSAAHLYGRERVSAEAFTFLLEGLAITPEALRRRANEFFAAGVQQIVGHGASYAFDPLDDGQAWYPWRQFEFGTQLDPNSALWRYLRPLNDYLARTQTLLRAGRPVVRVAVLAPLDLFAFDGAGAAVTQPAWDAALQAAGHDWDWINAHGLLQCQVQGGALVTPGGHRYNALMLPACKALRAEVAEHMARCAARGLAIVLIDGAPSQDEGAHDAAARDERVRQAMGKLKALRCRVAAAHEAGTAVASLGIPASLSWLAGEGLRFVERRVGERRLVLVFNRPSREQAVGVRLPGRWRVSQLDGWHGDSIALATQPGQLNGQAHTDVSLTLGAREVALLWAEPAALGQALPARSERGLPTDALPVGAAGWSVIARGRGLRWRPIEARFEWPALQDAATLDSLADFSGELSYQTWLDLSDDWLAAAAQVWLDLGCVHDVAGVRVNDGEEVLMCEGPFVLALGNALKPGRNLITVTTANVPENALRDPASPGGLPLPGRRLTRLPTGLLGPVRIRTQAADAVARWRAPIRNPASARA